MRDPDAKNKIAAFHRIAHASVGGIPEDETHLRSNEEKSIIEAVVRSVRIRPHQLPRLATVRGLVKPRKLSCTRRHHDRRPVIKCLDRAKIQRLATRRNCAGLPGLAVIGSAQNRAATSTRPSDFMANVVNPAKTGMAMRILDLPLGMRD